MPAICFVKDIVYIAFNSFLSLNFKSGGKDFSLPPYAYFANFIITSSEQTFTQKANDIPTKQTYTFMAVRCDRRKQEKPVPEMTPGRGALCLERLKIS